MIAVVILLILFIAAATAYALTRPTTPEPTQTTDTSKQDDASTDTKNPDQSTPPPTPDGSKTPSNNTTDDEATDTGGITITTPVEGSTVTKGSTLYIRALITQTGTGTCQLTLSKQGETSIIKSADIQSDAQSSTCQGFNVETDSMSTGIWKASISASINGQSLKASRDVTIGN